MRKEIVFSLALGFMVFDAHSAPETLRFEGPAGEFFVKVDYDRAPDRVPPPGAHWSDFERDSAWTEVHGGSVTYHVRYTHVFYVSQGGQNGVGFDHIRFDHPAYPDGQGAISECSFSFLFLDGDKETVYTGLGRHFKARTDLDPQRNAGFEIGHALSVQTFQNFLPTGSGEAVARARLVGFDGRLGPGPFHTREYAGR